MRFSSFAINALVTSSITSAFTITNVRPREFGTHIRASSSSLFMADDVIGSNAVDINKTQKNRSLSKKEQKLEELAQAKEELEQELIKTQEELLEVEKQLEITANAPEIPTTATSAGVLGAGAFITAVATARSTLQNRDRVKTETKEKLTEIKPTTGSNIKPTGRITTGSRLRFSPVSVPKVKAKEKGAATSVATSKSKDSEIEDIKDTDINKAVSQSKHKIMSIIFSNNYFL